MASITEGFDFLGDAKPFLFASAPGDLLPDFLAVVNIFYV